MMSTWPKKHQALHIRLTKICMQCYIYLTRVFSCMQPQCLRDRDKGELEQSVINDIIQAGQDDKLPSRLQPIKTIVELACFFALTNSRP